MMKLKFILLLITSVWLFSLLSCKKNNNSQFLLSGKVSGNVITLTWTNLNTPSLTGYTVYRIADSNFTSPSPYVSLSKNTTTMTDTLLLAPKVQYYVVATYAGQPLETTNKVNISRSDINFASIIPYDALYDQNNQVIYVYSSSGNIAVYDLNTKKWTQQISLNSSIGYCDIGVYNGKTELYIPRSDGWLFIYDAATLTQIDQINVGSELYSVTYNNGLLFIDGVIGTSGNDYIVSYNRPSKSLVGQVNIIGNTRLRLVPGTNSEFYGVSSFYDLFYFKFDGNGNYVSRIINNNFSGSSLPNPGIFEVFPNGNDMINTSTGIIFNKSLVYMSNLPYGNNFYSSFCFDNTNQLIYAGCTQRHINAYAMSDYQLSKTINTQGYPFKIFYANGTITSVSMNLSYMGSAANTYVAIEQF